MKTVKKKATANYWNEKLKNFQSFDQKTYESFSSESKIINNDDLTYFSKITSGNETAEFTVLLSVYIALCQRYFEGCKLIFTEGITKENDSELLFAFNPIKGKTIKQYIQEVKEEVQKVYKYSDHQGVTVNGKSFDQYTLHAFAYDAIIKNKSIPFQQQIRKLKNGDYEIVIAFSDKFVTKNLVTHFLENFANWLVNLETNITQLAERVSILAIQDKKIILDIFNDTTVNYDLEETLISLFETQVRKTPNNNAIILENKELSYKELNEQSNQLSHYLRSLYGIASTDLVGVKLQRNENLLVAVLAALKAGACYVPIDINYPKERIAYIEQDSNCKVVIDEEFLNIFSSKKEEYSKDNLSLTFDSDSLAYIIYTSGTTGNPKGVMIPHSSAVSLIHWSQSEFDSSSFDIVYAATSHCFDLSIFEMFYPLSIGKTIRLLSSGLDLVSYLDTDQRILLNTVPSNIRKILEEEHDLSNVTVLNLAGEFFPVDIANKLVKTSIEVRNLYGPSEDTTYSTYYRLDEEEYTSSISIGKPISNTRAYILDDNLELLPIGVSGRLFLSGAGLSRGYLNRDELTNEKFISDPFNTSSKMYDTGDLARWMPDGNIEFLGRKDDQVKLRGYRIELGEIENTILSFSEDIVQAMVIVKKDTLVVYYTENNVIDILELKGSLKEKLPAHMVPSHYVALDIFPLTPNGKIDRNYLESLSIDHQVTSVYEAPRNEIEQELVLIWQEILGLEKVGIRDNFFELGGHSLMLGQVINQIYKRLNGKVSYKSFFESPVISSLSKSIINSNYTQITKCASREYYPLTPSQHRIWLLSQLEGSSVAYNMSGVLQLNGLLDIEYFKSSFEILLEKHEILRTNFRVNDSGEVGQYIVDREALDFEVEVLDFKDHSKEEIEDYIVELQSMPFDLEQGSLLRVCLLHTGDDEYLFSLVMHHLIGDGWSMELLTSEIVTMYNMLHDNTEFEKEELSIQYKDYSTWLTSQLDQDSYKISEQYWLEQFEGALPVLELPSLHSRPTVQTYKGNTLRHYFSTAFTSKVKAFSRAQEATLFMTLMSGINALLYRYTNQQDIIVGTPIAGRDHPDLENQLGLYLNTLAIRTKVESDCSFTTLLEHQGQTLLEAYEHQNYPFDELISKLDLKRDTSRSPLFDVMVVLQNQKQVSSLSSGNNSLNGIASKTYEMGRNSSHFDMSFTFIEEDTLSLEIEYNTDIYSDFLVSRMFTHFENLLNQVIDNPNEKIHAIEYLKEEESQQLLVDFNDTSTDYPRDKTIVDLFETQARKTPNNNAIILENKELSYKELNEQSNQLSHYLRSLYGIASTDLVGVKLQRNENLLVAVLAALKAGACYVPIDINYPKERIAYIEQDSNCKVVIDEEFLNIFSSKKEEYSKDNLSLTFDSDSLAYIIYTSGTTGNPKGVMIPHSSAVSLIHWSQSEFDSSSFDIVYAATSHCFDLSIFEMFYPLSIGKTIRLLNSGLDLVSYLDTDQRILLNTVPSNIRKILEEEHDLSNVTVLNLAGEFFPVDIANKLVKTSIEVRNLYGPSEDTTYSTYYRLDEEEYTSSISIGKPISNTRAYILDDNLELLPIGVSGRLFLSGAGLSRGYLNRDELTNEKFISDPFNTSSKMYDTGDLARWMPDGNIEFLGRKDDQVKLRGYRIELGEIENTILSFSEDIVQAMVIVKKDTLVVYYTENNVIDILELKGSLKEKLPAHMVPSHYVALDIFPLTPNGKIDRNYLESLSIDHQVTSVYEAPRNEIEQELVLIWQEILGLEKVGIRDNFFELGGHSLMLGQVINQIYKRLNGKVSYKSFFESPVISSLSKSIINSNYTQITKCASREYYPLTPSQHRIWLLSQLEGSSVAYNMSGVLQLNGLLDIEYFKSSFEILLEKHEILRTNFRVNDSGEVGQYIVDREALDFEVEVLDFKDHSKEEIEDYIVELQSMPFDLEQGSLLRVCLLHTGDDEYLFSLVMHHLIGDGWSMELLTSEIVTMYNMLHDNTEFEKEELSIQYKDYSTWLTSQLDQDSYKISEQYWLEQFEGALPVLELPSLHSRPTVQTYKGNTLRHYFSTAFTSKVKAFSRAQEATLFMTLMSGINALLYRYTNQQDIIVGTPIAGRDHPDLENQLGLYLNTLAIRTKVESDCSFTTLLEHQGQTLLEAYEHQNYPFDELISKLDLKRDTSRSPLFDVMVVLQNQKQVSSLSSGNNSLNGIASKTYEMGRNSSHFDMSFTFIEEDTLSLEIEYNTDIYSDFLVSRMFTHFENLLNQVIDNPNEKIHAIEYLKEEESQQLLVDFNDTSTDYPRDKTIVDLFETQQAVSPQNIAIQIENQSISYDELDQISNKLAAYLIKTHDVKPKDHIGVKLERNEWLIISFLTVLKLNSIYIPIDGKYPQERIDFIKQDSNCNLIIDDELINLFIHSKQQQEYSRTKIDPNDIAYIIYTSGTTGQPKGAMVSHQNLLNLCFWHKKEYKITEESKSTLFAGIAFDASIWEIAPYLLFGATIFPINNENTRLNIEELCSFLNENKISHSYLPTAICHELIDKNKKLTHTSVLTGGDSLKIKNVPQFELYNNYGPTENTVVTTSYNAKQEYTSSVPIGKPISNTRIYVLGEHLELLPVGVLGTLYISGDGVTKGYLNRPELTLEKFIDNPFEDGQKMYNTGDVVKWLADGNIEFSGRKDDQVKLRGYRIELGEIENAILSFSKEISQAIAIVNNEILAVYYTEKSMIDVKALKNNLKDKLPGYMIPNHCVAIETMPLTSNGKVDKKALGALVSNLKIDTVYEAPRNETERKLVDIWQEVLGRKKIGVQDNFFDLGGQSLILTRLLGEYQKHFNKKIKLQDVYSKTDIESHAKIIKESTLNFSKIEKQVEKNNYPISSTQMRYWLIYKIKGKSKEFNIYNNFSLPNQVDIGVLKLAFQELVIRHESLRTLFVEDKGIPRQQIITISDIDMPVFDEEKAIENYVYNHEFELNKAPLFRVGVLENDKKLYFNLHHSIGDGWSMHILYRDLMELYSSKIENRNAILPELEVQYKDYSVWQNKLFESLGFSESKSFWQQNLEEEIQYLQLPYDFNVSNTSRTQSGSFTCYINENLKNKFIEYSKKSSVSMFSVFMASFKLLLFYLSENKDSIVGIPTANRNHYQLKDIAGSFLNTLMIRDKINENQKVSKWIQNVHESIKDALIHQSYPFEKVLEDLAIVPQEGKFPISPVFLNLVDFELSTNDVISSFDSHHSVINSTPKFEIEYYIKTCENGIEIRCVYDKELFLPKSIEEWSNAFISIINQVLSDDSNNINSLNIFKEPLFLEEELRPNNPFETFLAKEIEQTIAQRFEKQVQRHPDKTAVLSNGKQISYKELNNRANYVASMLLRAKPINEGRVALLLPHNHVCVVGMLATLKLGLTYVPIDPNTPLERIHFILQDANCESLLYTSESQSLIKKITNTTIEFFEILNEELVEDIQFENIPSDSEEEAYVLYTSGSTGNPKGVMQSHKNVLHYIQQYTNNIRISEDDNLSVFSSYTFDASVKDIYGAILNGATVSFYSILENGLDSLLYWLNQNRVSIIHMVPTLYRGFIANLKDNEKLETVRLLDLGGESCHKKDFELFKKFFKQDAFLVNDYGPTEATIISQKFYSHTSEVFNNNLSLGKAVEKTEVFLLKENGERAGIYQKGEIVFKSDYLSLGYLNREDLNKKVFTTDPLTGKDRIYRSGDIGFLKPDGEIEFLQRKDSQIKLNGFRIELDEISYQIEKLDSVKKAVVLLQKVENNLFITAYCQVYEEMSKEAFQENLDGVLPAYMIPKIFIVLDSFPLTRTGKIDKKLLPLPTVGDLKNTPYVEPITTLEIELRQLWAEVLLLNVTDIGIRDNFFELGGNSLQGVVLINKINNRYDTVFNVSDLYKYINIEQLAVPLEFTINQRINSIPTEASIEEEEIIL